MLKVILLYQIKKKKQLNRNFKVFICYKSDKSKNKICVVFVIFSNGKLL